MICKYLCRNFARGDKNISILPIHSTKVLFNPCWNTAFVETSEQHMEYLVTLPAELRWSLQKNRTSNIWNRKKLGYNPELKCQNQHPYKEDNIHLKQNHTSVTAAAWNSCWVLASDEQQCASADCLTKKHLTMAATGPLWMEASERRAYYPARCSQPNFETLSMRMQSFTQKNYQRLTVVVT